MTKIDSPGGTVELHGDQAPLLSGDDEVGTTLKNAVGVPQRKLLKKRVAGLDL